MKGESQASLAWAWAELGNKLSQDFPGQVGGWLGQKSWSRFEYHKPYELKKVGDDIFNGFFIFHS